MNCGEVRHLIHEFIDLRLDPRTTSCLQGHISNCPSCAENLREIRGIQGALAVRFQSPGHLRDSLAGRMRRSRKPPLHVRFWDAVECHLARWRDLDREIIWTKMTALPVTLCFFLVVLPHLYPLKTERLTYRIISIQNVNRGQDSRPVVVDVEVFQRLPEFNELVRTVWKLPYEDSLSVVAEITPEGNARIGDVLEIPRSYEFLNAVNLALLNSQFDVHNGKSRPFLIYSFQKIDVWEDGPGFNSSNRGTLR